MLVMQHDKGTTEAKLGSEIFRTASSCTRVPENQVETFEDDTCSSLFWGQLGMGVTLEIRSHGNHSVLSLVESILMAQHVTMETHLKLSGF